MEGLLSLFLQGKHDVFPPANVFLTHEKKRIHHVGGSFFNTTYLEKPSPQTCALPSLLNAIQGMSSQLDLPEGLVATFSGV